MFPAAVLTLLLLHVATVLCRGRITTNTAAAIDVLPCLIHISFEVNHLYGNVRDFSKQYVSFFSVLYYGPIMAVSLYSVNLKHFATILFSLPYSLIRQI